MAMIKRIAVTGLEGQVVRCLLERGRLSKDFDVVALGRPQFDLSQPDRFLAMLSEVRPDVIVSAAAYTAVDQAETEPELATLHNATAAGALARAAAELSVPIIHLSTDYVFDGSKAGPYLESDPVAPLGIYGQSKLAGEKAVSAATGNHVILRTAWVYSPYGKNFVKTMLRLAKTHDAISVVEDQIGNPTSALDIADGILTVARNLLDSQADAFRGTFHMTGTGTTSWAAFAQLIFDSAKAIQGPSATVLPIPTSAYPTLAKRPANSQLACGKLETVHAVKLAAWTDSAPLVVGCILSQ